jgi:UDP-GlcNAc:undecaprenyl-phosphate/decaprenyl-phosphate GlcNAc-1-phosphate transferase
VNTSASLPSLGLLYASVLTAAALTTWLTLPAWRAWCRRAGVVDDPGHRKIHSTPIPLAGGPAVMTGLLVPLIAGWIALHGPLLGPGLTEALAYGWQRRAPQLGAILAGALAMVFLGWLDDKYELRPAPKFAGQCVVALAVAASGVRITLFVLNLLFSYFITILWILIVINAFNFMDNMNGLCAGLGTIAALSLAGVSAGQGQYLVTFMALLMGGALLGFLPYNYPRATAFLGDAGSHLTGYLLAVLAVLPHFYTPRNPRSLAVLSPLLILAVPLGDLAWVVGLRWRLGQPFYVGDNNHLSHRLVRRGWSRARAVLLIWGMAALCGGAAVWLLH